MIRHRTANPQVVFCFVRDEKVYSVTYDVGRRAPHSRDSPHTCLLPGGLIVLPSLLRRVSSPDRSGTEVLEWSVSWVLLVRSPTLVVSTSGSLHFELPHRHRRALISGHLNSSPWAPPSHFSLLLLRPSNPTVRPVEHFSDLKW